jgi:ferredoxin
VDEEACIQCDYCMESGCPALVMVGDYPRIRDWECIGCDICAQLCPVDAIFPVTEREGAGVDADRPGGAAGSATGGATNDASDANPGSAPGGSADATTPTPEA